MEEENTTSENVETSTEATEIVSQEQVQSENRSKPAGYDPVDLSDLPEDKQKALEDRFGYLYGQVKQRERESKETSRILSEYRTIAQEQAQKIEELMSNVGQVVTHIQDQNTAQTEANLRNQLALAHQSQDYDAVAAINEQLLELKAQKYQMKNQPKVDKKQPAVPQAQEGVGIEFSPQDNIALDAWQGETDASGNPVRPWAIETHPMFNVALQEAQIVLTSPAYKNWTFDQKLAEVDRRMGLQRKSSPSQSVIGSNLTGRAKPSKITMSPEIQKFAVRMKYAGPNAKSDAEHIEAYRKQMEKVQSSNKRNR